MGCGGHVRGCGSGGSFGRGVGGGGVGGVRACRIRAWSRRARVAGSGIGAVVRVVAPGVGGVRRGGTGLTADLRSRG